SHADLVHPLRALRRVELVDLRQHDDCRKADLAEKVEHAAVVVRWIVADIEKLHYAAQLRTIPQKPLDQRAPFRALLLGDSRVAVPWQVHENEGAVDLEEVDLSRANFFRWISLLGSDDLPTFDRPAKAISGSDGSGRQPPTLAIPPMNSSER